MNDEESTLDSVSALPLSGIVVVDLSQAMQGPAATQVLADFGARVIKVERPGGGDLARYSMDRGPDDVNNPVFVSMNRGKESVVLDLRSDEGRDALLRLIERADVLVSNFRPGAMERMGLDYESLSRSNPGLIYAVGSTFGSDGPASTRSGLDSTAQAASGFAMRRSNPHHPVSLYATSVADYTGAMHLVQGILLALRVRDRDGTGQRVEVNLTDGLLAMQMQEASYHLMRGYELNWGAEPLNCIFETRDKPVCVIGAFRPDPLRTICEVLGIDDLSENPQFSDDKIMRENFQELRALLEPAFLTRSGAEWIERLDAADILCGPVLTLPEALTEPQTIHNGMIWELPSDGAERQLVVGSPVHLSATPATPRRGSPGLGQHTAGVLDEVGLVPAQGSNA